MPTITAQLTDISGNIIAAVPYAANPDGTAPMLIGVPAPPFSATFTRGPDTPSVLGAPTDWYTLAGPAAAPGETTDIDASNPGRGSPGLASPGDPGGTVTAVTYTYGYAYSAPVLTPVGENSGRT